MIILGSQSPRRRELVSGLGIPFRCVRIDADEHYPLSLQKEEIPIYIARAKARAFSEKINEGDVLITSDTIVWLDGQMLGKPCDMADALRMLHLLSGRTHQVYTAVCFYYFDKERRQWLEDSIYDTTDVTFLNLSDEEIEYYIEKYHPFDKAGAYGIQEWIGYIGVTSIRGSYFNVMGFPISKVYAYLKGHQLV